MLAIENRCEMNTQTDRKLPIGVGIPQSLLNKIDALRGKKSRSAFIVDLLQEVIREKFGKAEDGDR